MEIAAGLKSGKTVLPVLLGGATMPVEKDLPPSISALARRQAMTLSDAGWAADVARLVAALEPLLPAASQRKTRSWWVWGGAALALIALLFVGLKGFQPVQTALVPNSVSVEKVQNFFGNWQAKVKYDWGAEHAERFELRLDNGEVHGTASYLGVARTVEAGRLTGEQLSFVTRSQEMLGDGPSREVSLPGNAPG